MDVLNKGLEYIEAGISIHLLRPLNKMPLYGSDWAKVPNLKKEDFYEQLKETPDANIGVRLGEHSKIGEYFLYVIDLDISSDDSKDILKAYEVLSSFYKDFSKLPCVNTSSKNSRHFYFLSKLILKSKKLATSDTKVTVTVNGADKVKNSWEIDLMSTGRQVVIPPSVFNSNQYRWERDVLEYLKDDSKKALMIINDFNDLSKKEEKEVEVTKLDVNLTNIKEYLSKLDKEWLNDYSKWVSIGMALHQEYADTDDESEAMGLYEEWSKTGDKYEKGACLKKWKSFNKRDDGITLGTLLYTVIKPNSMTKIEAFSKFINNTVKLDFDSLKKALIDYKLSDIELELFLGDISDALSLTFNKKINLVNTRRIIAGFKKEQSQEAYENKEKLEIGLDDSLAQLIIDLKFDKGNHLINQGNNIFHYTNGVWVPMEIGSLAKITYTTIRDIIISENKEYDLIKEKIRKNKKQDNLNELTNNIVSVILKLRTFSSHEDILNLQRKKDHPYSVINTLNKEIYIQDGKITVQDHAYDSYLLSQMNVDYVAGAECPTFNRALLTYFKNLPDNKEVIRHLLECFGLIIQSKKGLDMFMMFFGNGKNGKSAVVEVLAKMIGMQSCLNVSINKFTKSGHSDAALLGKLLLIDDDVKKSDVLDDGFLKKTSRSTAITADPKFKEQITFINNCTTLLICNNPPPVKDTSLGLARRAMIFPFNYQLQDKEIDLKFFDKIALERSGILNLLIKSYINLSKRGHFIVPLSCLKARQQWLKSSNPLLAFIEEKLTVTGDATDRVKGQLLFSKYNDFVRLENLSFSLTRNNFYSDMSVIDKISLQKDSHDGNYYITGIKIN